MRRSLPLAAAFVLVSGPADAQTPAPAWSLFASAYTYIVPDAANYGQPTLTADRGRLHLEGRYNYEAKKTGSVWAGYNLSGGSTIEWELTPMAGAVFGSTSANSACFLSYFWRP